jgi:hypothetical protein
MISPHCSTSLFGGEVERELRAPTKERPRALELALTFAEPKGDELAVRMIGLG